MERLKLNIQLFASASKSNSSLKSTAGNRATLTASFTEADLTTGHIANNKTSITATATITMNTGAFSGSSIPYLYIYWHDNKNNTDVLVDSKQVSAIAKGESASVSGTIEVEHLDDGTLRGYAYAKWVYDGTSKYVPQSGDVATDWTSLTTIPRATETPVISGNIGSSTTITLSPASTSFTHTIKYELGSLSGTVATNVKTSTKWNMPTTFYAQVGSSETSKTGTLIVETYNGSTLVGTTSDDFTAVVAESSANPTVTISSVVDINAVTTALTGDSAKIILNASTARVTFTVTARASSTLKSVTINGKTISVTSGTAKTYDISKINTNKITVIAVDSRGFTTTKTHTISSTVSYTQLTSNPSIARIVPVTNNQLKISGSGNYYATNFGSNTNTLAIRYRYKLSTATSYGSWTTITPSINTTNKKYSFSYTPTTTFDYTKVYEFQVQVYDKITTLTTTATVVRGVPIFWISSDSFTVEVTFNNKSLESRKKNFEDFNESALDIIKKGIIYKFHYDIDEEDSKKHLGFVIPDKGGNFIVPDEVITNDKTGVDTYSMTSICWKAIQEQQEIIEELQNKIKNMEK